MNPIIPIVRREPFDDPALLFEIKLDGFRAIADTVAGRFISKNGNALKRFASALDTLPNGYVFDGELVALDDDGRPMFNDLMFGRREPVFVPFDVLVADGENVCPAAKRPQGTAHQDRSTLPATEA
jgi:ATP-dependent DNA ligase